MNARGAPLYVQDVFAGSDPAYSVPYRFVGEYAVHAMFAHNMFPKSVEGIENAEDKRWTMLNVQSFRCEPERDGSHSDRGPRSSTSATGSASSPGGADYCGLVKKTIFTVMNFLLPSQGFLSMHCSANVGERGDAAILFGLSGTGKTTLSADPERRLIGRRRDGLDGRRHLESGGRLLREAHRPRQGGRAGDRDGAVHAGDDHRERAAAARKADSRTRTRRTST